MTGTMTHLSFDVVGLPAPQGSKRHVGRGILIESSKAVGPWRDSVAYAARAAARDVDWVMLDAACQLTVLFWLPRPVSLPKRRVWPDRRPDLDKLVRATCDALTTAGVISDDARIVMLHAYKLYGSAWSGASVQVSYALDWPAGLDNARNT